MDLYEPHSLKQTVLSWLWGSPRGMITAKYMLFSDLNFHHRNSFRSFSITRFPVLWAASPLKLEKALTYGGVKVPWCVGTHRAALSGGHLGVLTLQQVLTLDFIAKNSSIVTDTDLTRWGLPNIPVQVHLSILSAGYFFTIFSWDREENIQHIFQPWNWRNGTGQGRSTCGDEKQHYYTERKQCTSIAKADVKDF